MRSHFSQSLAALTLLAATSAHAQDFHAAPTIADRALIAGAGESETASVQGGGGNDISARNPGCSGFAASAPEVRVLFTAGAAPLAISLQDNGQATLIVNMPNGRWLCAPADAPSLRFDPPRSGRYAIWIGAPVADTPVTARIIVSEAVVEAQ